MVIIERPTSLPNSVSEWQIVLRGLSPEVREELNKAREVLTRLPLEQQAFEVRKRVVERTAAGASALLVFLELVTREGKYPPFVAVIACAMLATRGIAAIMARADEKQRAAAEQVLLSSTSDEELQQVMEFYPHILEELLQAIHHESDQLKSQS